MFCPSCGIQNEVTHGYCRQCGQALSAVGIALKGSSNQSLEKLRFSDKWITAGFATMTAFAVIALILGAVGFAAHDLILPFIGLLNAMLGLLIGLPLILVGKVSLRRATRLLSGSDSGSDSKLVNTSQERHFLKTGLEAKADIPAAHDSVTEHTTREL